VISSLACCNPLIMLGARPAGRPRGLSHRRFRVADVEEWLELFRGLWEVLLVYSGVIEGC
jgi:hypothetical protein